MHLVGRIFTGTLSLSGLLLRALLAMTLLAVAAFLWLIGTTGGLQFALDRAVEFAPGELIIESSDGELAGEMTLTGVSYRQGQDAEEILFRADRLLLRWHPYTLLSGTFTVDAVEADAPFLMLPKSESEQPEQKEEVVLPTIELPVDIAINALSIKEFMLQIGSEAEPIPVGTLSLVARTEQDSIQINDLRYQGFEVDTTIRGTISLTDKWPMELDADWRYPLPHEDVVLIGRLAIVGDLDQAMLNGRLSSPSPVSIDGTLSDPINNLSWTAAISSAALEPGKFYNSLTSEKLTLTAQAKGDTGHADISQLAIEKDAASLQLTGKLSWADAIVWNATVNTRQLPPTLLWPESASALSGMCKNNDACKTFANLEAKTSGQMIGELLTAKVDISQLNGQLQGWPLTGSGGIAVDGSIIQINKLKLASGNNKLQADGKFAEQSDLRFTIEMPELQALIAGAGGEINAEVQVRGSQQEPFISGELHGQDVRWQAEEIAEIDANWSLDASGNESSALAIGAKRLLVGGRPIDTLTLNGSGVPDNHELTASADLRDQQVSITLQGAVDFQSQQWSGEIAKLGVTDNKLGTWDLRESAALQAGPKQVKLSLVCLTQNDGALCADAAWTPAEGASGNAAIDKVPLSLANWILPPELYLLGNANGNAQFSIVPGAAPAAKLEILSEDAALGTYLVEDEQGKWELRDLIIGAELADWQARIVTDAVLQKDGYMEANLNISALNATPTIVGKIEAGLPDLGIVSVMAPDVQRIDGKADVNVELRGQLTEPDVKGLVEVNIVRAELASLGIAIEDLQATIRGDDNGPLQVDGAFQAGGGEVAINGQLQPESTGVSGKLSVTGNRLQVLKTPEIKARVTPNIELELSERRIDVDGSVELHGAELKIESGESVVNESSDVVIVEENPEEDVEAPPGVEIAGNVELILKEPLKVEGEGVKASVTGKLDVEIEPGKAERGNGKLLISGRYKAYGQDLTITEGQLIFVDSPLTNPALDIKAERKAGTPTSPVTVGLRITGTAETPIIQIYSQPVMAESEALSYLVLGRPLDQASADEGRQVSQAALALGVAGGNFLAKLIGERFNVVDELYIDSDRDAGAFLVLGKQIGKKLYVSFKTGLVESVTALNIRYTLNKYCRFEGETSGLTQGADLLCEIER